MIKQLNTNSELKIMNEASRDNMKLLFLNA